ncbi:archaellin/type IV pilin N-terminal domain-containing protein, partial [Haloferax volcanii]
MNFKQLLAEDDAVSPVIGVILMVAITVILAA